MTRYDELKKRHADMSQDLGITPAGQPPSLPSSTSIPRKRRQIWLWLAALVILIALAGAWRLWRATSGSGRSPGELSAVSGSGTGFFIAPDGILLTAGHVIAGASGIAVKTLDGVFPAKVLLVDEANDIAVLEAAMDKPAPVLPVASSAGVKMGDGIFTIGFPNIGLQGINPKLTRGEISSLSGIQDDPRVFQISVPVQPGNSGGPLVDLSGQVVGIVVARLGDAEAFASSGLLPQNVNYAIKSAYVRSLLENNAELAQRLPSPSATPIQNYEQAVESARAAVALVLTWN